MSFINQCHFVKKCAFIRKCLFIKNVFLSKECRSLPGVLACKRFRAKAVCLFRNNGKILLAEGYDPIKDEHYVLPLGGGVDFGELSQAAAEREVQEEISAATKDFLLLGVSENIFPTMANLGMRLSLFMRLAFRMSRFISRILSMV
nr:NUDIX domain-containing protein [Pectobacterium colocasium]